MKNSKDKDLNQNEKNREEPKIKSLKCELLLTANGDYPLIRIADVRNNIVGTNNL